MILCQVLPLLLLEPSLFDLLLVGRLNLMQLEAAALIFKTYGSEHAAELIIQISNSKIDPGSVPFINGWPAGFEWLVLPKEEWPLLSPSGSSTIH